MYANFAQVTHSDYEFTIDFASLDFVRVPASPGDLLR